MVLLKNAVSVKIIPIPHLNIYSTPVPGWSIYLLYTLGLSVYSMALPLGIPMEQTNITVNNLKIIPTTAWNPVCRTWQPKQPVVCVDFTSINS